YIGDQSSGQVTGNGVSSWYVATPDLKPPSGSSRALSFSQAYFVKYLYDQGSAPSGLYKSAVLPSRDSVDCMKGDRDANVYA
ncbi:MAG TPA: hypothetical protein VGN34_13740, partial [Ktedonobacteraceae bacterium]